MARSARRHRRAHAQEDQRHDRWLVSYADFITLMFALFVVMYSVSSVNAGKYRVLSDTLGEVFAEAAGAPPRSVGVLNPSVEAGGNRPVSVITPAANAPTLSALEQAGAETAPLKDILGKGGDGAGDQPRTSKEAAARIADRVGDRLGATLAPEDSKVKAVDGHVEIELDSSVIFGSGSARIGEAGVAALRAVAAELRPLNASVRVEGHTDDQPIATAQFASNWDLSAARAASVVRLFAEQGLVPEHLSAVGFGQYKPVADNADEAGRARNRRVLIVVSGAPARPGEAIAAPAPGAGYIRIDRFPAKETPEP
ncbi:MAG: flagellar motor protein MotB [Gammaproteobacteria bacterium]